MLHLRGLSFLRRLPVTIRWYSIGKSDRLLRLLSFFLQLDRQALQQHMLCEAEKDVKTVKSKILWALIWWRRLLPPARSEDERDTLPDTKQNLSRTIARREPFRDKFKLWRQNLNAAFVDAVSCVWAECPLALTQAGYLKRLLNILLTPAGAFSPSLRLQAWNGRSGS